MTRINVQEQATKSQRLAIAKATGLKLGLQVKHFRPTLVTAEGTFLSTTGGITVAFARRNGSSFLDIAVANCSRGDTFDRKYGTTIATEQFSMGNVIRLPLNGMTAPEAMERLFRGYFTAFEEILELGVELEGQDAEFSGCGDCQNCHGACASGEQLSPQDAGYADAVASVMSEEAANGEVSLDQMAGSIEYTEGYLAGLKYVQGCKSEMPGLSASEMTEEELDVRMLEIRKAFRKG